jgi:Tfp pilus assembly protein PilF
MRAVLALVACVLLLAACSSVPASRTRDAALLDDSLFAPPTERIDAADVFAVSPQMRSFLDTAVAAEVRDKGRQLGLFYALYGRRGEPWLDYDATMTRTAAEAYAAGSGNCLSLVLMTAAFARELGLEVRFQSIDTWKSWSRDDTLRYVNSHVNIVLLTTTSLHKDDMVIDFLPVTANQASRVRVVDEASLVAMYMNNRAVELMAQHEFDRAYWWVRAAMRQDPDSLDAVNTLAVLYNQHGNPLQAEHALRWLLAQEPDNLIALDNLAISLHLQGRDREAQEVTERVAQLRPVPPFYYFDLGEAALKDGKYLAAKKMFLKEMRRDAHYDKFHASLALAHYGLGELDKAQAQMAMAVDNSTTAADRALYSRMLARLRMGERP